MNPYNGYTGKERDLKLREMHKRGRRGEPICLPGPCDICRDPLAAVEPHAEDYSLPHLWDRPAEYPLCRLCDRHKLHQRFVKPDLWEVHKAHVRRGGYSSDLKRPEIAAELKALRSAMARGETYTLRPLRPRDDTIGEWWEALSSDPATLTSPSARPRP